MNFTPLHWVGAMSLRASCARRRARLGAVACLAACSLDLCFCTADFVQAVLCVPFAYTLAWKLPSRWTVAQAGPHVCSAGGASANIMRSLDTPCALESSLFSPHEAHCNEAVAFMARPMPYSFDIQPRATVSSANNSVPPLVPAG